jgi:hypothetical protein
MTLFLLSLTGIPPTAGFFAKANIILAAVEAGGPLTILAVITVLNAAVAAFYYLRVVVYMFMRERGDDAPALRHGALLWAGWRRVRADDPAGLFPTGCSMRPGGPPRRSSRALPTRRSSPASASGWPRRAGGLLRQWLGDELELRVACRDPRTSWSQSCSVSATTAGPTAVSYGRGA